ncbi:type IV pilus assembly protein PilN [Desulfuromonas versatilis]|uniref:Type IV pilus assembly protein PilN n=1 Tax=Desulfuromonas versatilis TaxID=2802975 RepID=A0ABN6DXA6_9BACT|nr:PilN domain-containing protein [Desulfuromonas versatilis]BCR04680.1 type IV pilus assembly protein PilN [Desulfuromonas versatilis]
MIRINLLPVRAAQKKEQLKGQLVILTLALIAVAVGCGGVYASLAGRVNDEKAAIAQKEAEINQLRKAIGEVAHFKKLQAELRGKLDVLDQLKAGKSGPVHLLDELSSALPDKLWILSFKESGGAVSLTGVGLNEETVAQFLRNLEASPYYQKVELQVVEQMVQSGLKMQKFNVNCRVEAPPKAPEK